MDFIKLKTFLSVACTGSFRRSAEELYLTPSTVSKHIAWLEDAYQVKLFSRSAGGAELTEEGKLFLPYAQRMLAENTAFISALNKNETRNHVVKICAIPALAMVTDYSIFSEFERLCPGVQLSIEEEHGQSISRLLDGGRYHLGMCALEYMDMELTEYVTLSRYEDMVLVPKCHRLAGRGVINLAELAGEQFVSLPEYTGVPELYRLACHRAGFEYRVSAVVEREENLVLAVSQSVGIAFVGSEYLDSGGIRRFDVDNVEFLRIEPATYWHFVLAKPRNRQVPLSAMKFWDYCRSLY